MQRTKQDETARSKGLSLRGAAQCAACSFNGRDVCGCPKPKGGSGSGGSGSENNPAETGSENTPIEYALSVNDQHYTLGLRPTMTRSQMHDPIEIEEQQNALDAISTRFQAICAAFENFKLELQEKRRIYVVEDYLANFGKNALALSIPNQQLAKEFLQRLQHSHLLTTLNFVEKSADHHAQPIQAKNPLHRLPYEKLTPKPPGWET